MLTQEDGDLEEEVEDTSLLSVVRHIRAIPKQEEDWKHTSTFRTIVCCETISQMLIIDGGREMNVVFEANVERLKLPIEPHSKPYKLAWINSTFIPVMKRCLVSISCGQYDSIWCDVIPMTVTHILLGRPWLYD